MVKSVLIVGGGPGGSAAAYWLARNGVDVHLVEKKRYPREKACGDGLTPRAIKQLLDMGFDFDGLDLHRIDGLRAYAGDLKIEMPWPEHSMYPNWGATMRRADLDGVVAGMAEQQGAFVEQGTTATPVTTNDAITAVRLNNDQGERTVHPDLVVIADGSNSRFGRGVGATRRKDYPFGLALRAYYESPNSDDRFIESQLDIRDAQGRAMPGYGWVFPLGDGEINVGAGLVSTFKGWKDVNTSRILEAYISSLPEHWKVVDATPHTKPIGGKLPMSLSVGPKVGRNWVLIGDASGAVNPFNGEGIDYAYETGRMAARWVAEAASGDERALAGYARELEDVYGDYHRVARVFVKVIGNPAVIRTLTTVGLRSKPLMEWTLKVMANLLDPDDAKMTEHIYKAIERVVNVGR
ncbi:MAG: geranylgeranyl reductase family protein [Actinomycetota bacterium]|nr:geranylgeranyl reductase family protein [Actinomycetota bacterium]MDK1017714.1 geranylgeranyl reductase family protein [Actinomycetota bacterium]MDK1027599.1 geranylgeranyl reductase family protein [Actinomycetota bacterium]MDK1038305.1 geranylgeranyl reductase family protein [Actinomycetota bacterium]MDK1097034.1 geranylgeranyl reductase family protein [Actinomycetota bacterium]